MPDFDIEQVNKVRLAMGMKPIPVAGAAAGEGPVFRESADNDGSENELASTYDTRQAAAGDNWTKLQEEQNAKAKRQAKKDAIRKAQETAQRFAKLGGKGLADADEVDTRAWLLSHKKKHMKVEKARKLERELLEREQQAQYTSADLAGVKVGHELDQFGESSDQILTLKDAAVDAESDDDDELENIDLRDAEKLHERLNAKKRTLAYNPNDETSTSNGILSQYDEEIDGKKHKNFKLDTQGTSKQAAIERERDKAPVSAGIRISLEALKDDTPISDYKEAKEVRVKKLKKSKARNNKRKALDEDNDSSHDPPASPYAETDVVMSGSAEVPVSQSRNNDSSKIIDDEELHANLAAQRRAAIKQRKRSRPEELARLIREEQSEEVHESTKVEREDEPGLVIDETSAFIANLQKPSGRERKRQVSEPLPSQETLDNDVNNDEDAEMTEDLGEVDSAAEALVSKTSMPADTTGTGLEDEATLNSGIGATLTMLNQRGIVKNAASGDINAIHRERQRFLAEKQKREAEAEVRARQQRERDRQSGKLEHMSTREREAYAQRTNATRDQVESRQMADIFNREYRPDVQLKYVDEYGRQMNQKEAFKHLSHQFHGKGSGKQKTEKRMKKIEDEKKKEAMSVLDASQNSTNMNSAVEGRAKRARQAGVRLQ